MSKFCSECAAPIRPGAKFCPKCGTAAEPFGGPGSVKSRSKHGKLIALMIFVTIMVVIIGAKLVIAPQRAAYLQEVTDLNSASWIARNTPAQPSTSNSQNWAVIANANKSSFDQILNIANRRPWHGRFAREYDALLGTLQTNEAQARSKAAELANTIRK